jgi:hypothetical protein
VFLNSISRSTLSEMFLNILYPLCVCVCVRARACVRACVCVCLELEWLSQYSVLLQTGRPGFDLRQWRKDFSSILCVQNVSGGHPASCTINNGVPFTGGKARPGRDADHSPHVVPRSLPHGVCVALLGHLCI